jgi:hypothetical protein
LLISINYGKVLVLISSYNPYVVLGSDVCGKSTMALVGVNGWYIGRRETDKRVDSRDKLMRRGGGKEGHDCTLGL